LAGKPDPAILASIEALTKQLSDFNAANIESAAPSMAQVSLVYKAGKELNDKPGGCFTVTMKAKPTASEVDLGKLTGRVKAVFMGVPKEWKHKMATAVTTGADGVKRWSLEVKFPFGTLDKINEKAGAKDGVTKAIAQFKEYLEKSNKNAVPFTSTYTVEMDSAFMPMIEFLDPEGKFRETARGKAGPTAEVPKQLSSFHAELLEHIDSVENFIMATPERQITCNLPNLKISDIFSEPSGMDKAELDFHPQMEMGGAIVFGSVAAARVAMPDKDLPKELTDGLAKILEHCPTRESLSKIGESMNKMKPDA